LTLKPTDPVAPGADLWTGTATQKRNEVTTVDL